LLDQGRIIADGSPADVLETYREMTLDRDPLAVETPVPDRAVAVFDY
jgi:hypothetical protein